MTVKTATLMTAMPRQPLGSHLRTDEGFVLPELGLGIPDEHREEEVLRAAYRWVNMDTIPGRVVCVRIVAVLERWEV